MRVDVSVLTPVLNEEEHIREAADDDARPALRRRRSSSCSSTAPRMTAPSRSSRSCSRGPARAHPREPARATRRWRSTSASRRRAASYIARMDAHTLYPEDYLARGVERLRRGGADHVSGPQLAARRGHLVAARGAGARDAARHAAARSSGTPRTTRSRSTAASPACGRARCSRRHGGWDEEWHNDQDSELAARIRGGGGRIVCLPEMGAELHPARQPLRPRAPVLALRHLPRQDLGRAPREHAPLPPARPRPGAGAGGAPCCRSAGLRRLGRAAVALWCAAVVGVATAEAWRGTPIEIAPCPRDVAALPAVFGAMHLAWGFGFLLGCVRFGPPLRALAHVARRSAA